MTDDLTDLHLIEPFGGRAQALVRLHQHGVRPAQSPALTFIGRARIGKTALLRRLPHILDPAVTIGLYFDLAEADLRDEARWLARLYTTAFEAALALGFSAERLPALPHPLPGAPALREWLTTEGYPGLLHVIRPHRRLICLLDNAGALIDALTDDAPTLPDDHPAYLASLTGAQFGWVLTVALDDEGRLDALAPLVNPADLIRLTALTPGEVGELFSGAPDSAISALVSATGGEPELLRAFWQVLDVGSSPAERLPALTASAVKAATPRVYAQCEPFLRARWMALTPNERLALTALASLLYDDPLKPIPPDRIEAWLTDSDYPADRTTIHVALRGLEYAELTESQAGGVRVRSGLQKAWLIEHARLPAPRAGGGLSLRDLPRRVQVALVVGLVALVLLALAVGLSPAPVITDDPQPAPTVSLDG